MAIGAALVDEPDDARRCLRSYRVRASENEAKHEGNSRQVSRHGQSIHPQAIWRLVAFVLVRAAIDEVADQAEQRERDHNDDADDKRKIQGVRTGEPDSDYTGRQVEAVTKSRNLASLAAFLAVLGVCRADAGQAPQPARQKIEVGKLGPQVGQQVPDFNLRDQTGRMRNLQSVMGPRGAMLVFLRSADW